MSIKGFLAVFFWALLGFGINTFFDPNTVMGSVMGSIFVLIWTVILAVGFFVWAKLKKSKKK
jgi:uncharacterized membrane protein YwzB|tara:strand:- start:540 stop:725 length:186 start_codon:yes stop_codon:yes gene_type:complete